MQLVNSFLHSVLSDLIVKKVTDTANKVVKKYEAEIKTDLQAVGWGVFVNGYFNWLIFKWLGGMIIVVISFCLLMSYLSGQRWEYVDRILIFMILVIILMIVSSKRRRHIVYWYKTIMILNRHNEEIVRIPTDYLDKTTLSYTHLKLKYQGKYYRIWRREGENEKEFDKMVRYFGFRY